MGGKDCFFFKTHNIEVILSMLSTGLLFFPVFFFHSPGLEVTFSYIIYQYFSFMSAGTINEVPFKGHNN